jgi:hypothetical protein
MYLNPSRIALSAFISFAAITVVALWILNTSPVERILESFSFLVSKYLIVTPIFPFFIHNERVKL